MYLRVLYTPHRGPVVVVSYGPTQLIRLLGLDTQRIIGPLPTKGVNHMAYLAHLATLCTTVCLRVTPSSSDITDVSTIGHSFKTDRSRAPSFHVRRRHYRPIIKSQKTARSVVGVEPTTFQTAATDDDKD